ncbi:MAG: hypothetical protein EOM37_02730 [Proteobacteria bacterium]|nr:hypothetical protein [Alphaproteobacteria bacterium]NCC02952.1 hypothetical protein [Pseudomonadota bacterium]
MSYDITSPTKISAPAPTMQPAEAAKQQLKLVNSAGNILKTTTHDSSGEVVPCCDIKRWLNQRYTGPTRPLRQKKSNMNTLLEARPHALN